MATRNLVPRANGEGSIGTSIKKWLSGYFQKIYPDKYSGGEWEIDVLPDATATRSLGSATKQWLAGWITTLTGTTITGTTVNATNLNVTNLTSDIVPDTDNSRTLGSASKQVKDIKVKQITLNGEARTAWGNLVLSDTATSSTTTSITKSTATWGTNVFANMAVKITSGAASGAIVPITSNTATVITIPTVTGLTGAITFEIFATGNQSLTQVLAAGPSGNIPAGQALDIKSSSGQSLIKVDERSGRTILPAVSAAIPALSYVAVSHFDNSKNPAWLDKCEDKSWDNETTYTGRQYVQTQYANDAAALAANPTIATGDIYFKTSVGFVLYTTGTTIYRAGSRKFPMKGFVTAESGRLIIWDTTGGTPTMWGVALTTANYWLHSGTITSLAVAGHTIVIGMSTQVIRFDMVADKAIKRDATDYRIHTTGFSGRNSAGAWVIVNTTDKIVNASVNSVAITYLEDAPLDEFGMRRPTIAVATAGGVSVIKNDGTVVNSASTTAKSKGSFSKNNSLFYGDTSGSNFNAAKRTTWEINNFTSDLSDWTYLTRTQPIANGLSPLSSGVDVSYFAPGTSTGLYKYIVDPSTPSSYMACAITSTYNSGLLIGSIRRCFLANSKTADRSVKAGTLTENGTVPSAAVMTSADLLGYGPFTAANNFTATSNADWDVITTGAAYLSGWFKSTGEATTTHLAGFGNAGDSIRFMVRILNTGAIISTDHGSVTSSNITSPGLFANGMWHKFDWVRRSSTSRELYVNGISQGSSTTDTGSLSATGTLPFAIGIHPNGSSAPALTSSLSLVRLAATAPTAEQIAFMYAQEKVLFETGATCLLSNSSSVSALSYDESTDVLSVGNGTAIDQFKGLKRLSAAAHGVTTLTGLASGAGDKVAVGTGGSFTRPERDVNSELKTLNQELAEARQGSISLYNTPSGTTYQLPQGFKPVSCVSVSASPAVIDLSGANLTFDGFCWTIGGLTGSTKYLVTARRV